MKRNPETSNSVSVTYLISNGYPYFGQKRELAEVIAQEIWVYLWGLKRIGGGNVLDEESVVINWV